MRILVIPHLCAVSVKAAKALTPLDKLGTGRVTLRRLAGKPHVPPLGRLGAGNAEEGKDEQVGMHGDHLPLT
jgi:hypothetical protein